VQQPKANGREVRGRQSQAEVPFVHADAEEKDARPESVAHEADGLHGRQNTSRHGVLNDRTA
jgi:hypothetical protein